MKKVLAIVSAVFILAAISTSCNKTGCKCYVKTVPSVTIFEDENMSKADCKDLQKQMNDEMGMDWYRCK